MSDKDLIADARAAMDYSDDTGWFWVGRLADALEAATSERAVVPDAATEEAFKKAEAFDKAVALSERRQTLLEEAEAERDAALAAIERVRAIHVEREHRTLDGTYLGGTVCDGCRRPWPCQTVAVLDGAPELDPYDDFCPTCDAPEPWHTATCAVPFRGAPEPAGLPVEGESRE